MTTARFTKTRIMVSLPTNTLDVGKRLLEEKNHQTALRQNSILTIPTEIHSRIKY